MSLYGLHRRCKALIRSLDIPSPFDVHALCQNIAQQQGRPIQLKALAMPAGSPCGLWVSTATNYYIFYEKQASPFHQEHIIVHELGHLLCGHTTAAVMTDETSRLLMPTLNPNMVERILQRTHYSTPEEKEAEMIASLILQGAERAPAELNRPTPEADETIRRVQRLLVHRHERHPRIR
ncbi:ImmA/IrrE family metallo-endopeptidase [Streptomyces sp. NPDC021622]|uniref:ImmA/IrrE family metallo-endopeptidase n=1 Tax=Streptomyces sp. NPDC021622 TaxID=3155013 RepID=UPI0033C8A738